MSPFRGSAPQQPAHDEPGRPAAQPVDPSRATRVLAWFATASALILWPAGIALAHLDYGVPLCFLGFVALTFAVFAWARLWQMRRESPEAILRRVYDADLAESAADALPSRRVRVDASASDDEAPVSEVEEEDKSRRAPVA